MSQFFFDYGLFLLKAVTVVAAVVLIIGVAASAGRKASQEGLEVESLNKKYTKLANALRAAVLNKNARKKLAKDEKRAAKEAEKTASTR